MRRVVGFGVGRRGRGRVLRVGRMMGWEQMFVLD